MRFIHTLGKANQATLRKELGFKTINEAIEFYGEDKINKKKKYSEKTKNIAYEIMRKEYNKIVEELKEQNKTQQKIKQKQQRQIKKIKTFMLDLKLKITYDKYPNKVFIKNLVQGPFTEPIVKIQDIINSYNEHDGYKSVEVLESHINYLNKEKVKKDRKPQIKQMMKRSYVLKNEWLYYAKNIADYAYDNTDDMCVYHQLTNYLLEPPTGRPTKFINGEKVSPTAIFNFLKSRPTDYDYHNLSMKDGVSTEQIADLCREIKRNLYVYDEDDKCFYNELNNNESRNYCPIVYYKLHGHMYILNNPDAIRSVAESNKLTAKKVITSSIDEKKDEIDLSAYKIYHIKTFNIESAMDMNSGIYLLQQSNITKETLKFISYYNSVPKTKNIDNVIVQIKYKNSKNDVVCIACDVNYGENIDYEQLKIIANNNNINYINEGIGSVILKIIENSKKHERKILSEEEKNSIIKEYRSCCAICKIKITKFEIDHIVPLSAGGSNDIDNLQPLCNDCHKQKTKEEKELGIYNITDETASYFNIKVCDEVVNSIAFKSWQFVEKVNTASITTYSKNKVEYIEHLDLWNRPVKSANVTFENVEIESASYKIDMQKCRRNITYYSKYDFPVYSVMDSPTEFSGEIKCGMFYVVTENTYPFRGTGWYYEPLVKYGLELNIISIINIKLEFIPSKPLPHDYFKNNIGTLMKAFELEPKLQKMCINAYIGLMGRTKRTISKSKFTLCPNEASEWWGVAHDNELADASVTNVFINNHKLDNGEILYEGIESQNVISETTNYPVYSMILQMEAMELHKLECLIEEHGGIILDRNTDAIRYSAKAEMEISNYFWDDEKQVPKYQKETAKPLQVERLANFCRADNLDRSKFELNWNITYDYHVSAEEKAKEIIESKKSFHIDGRAGTGKSYLTNKVIENLEQNDIKYLAFSPTNKGARIIGGRTIHSVYYKFKHNKYKLMDILKNIKYIIIDEISMMVEMFYQLFIMIKKMYPEIKFIISGDFAQLPPVNDNWSGDYKNSPAMIELCEGNRIQLIKCRRADDRLFKLCQNVQHVDASMFPRKEQTYLNIAYTHKTRIRVNNECMERFIQSNKCSYILLNKLNYNPKTQNVKLAVGMPVVAHTTNKKMNILNSEKFIVTEIDNKKITMKEHEHEVKVNIADFHHFFYLGFCITIHTSQGDTFNTKYTIYDWSFKHFCEKAKYVALSRATDINNIQIA